jgi:hypothetical protein
MLDRLAWAGGVLVALQVASCSDADDNPLPQSRPVDATASEDATMDRGASGDASSEDAGGLIVDASEASSRDAVDPAPNEAGDARARDVESGEPTMVKPPFDWVGIVGTGQSLSVGYAAGSISTTQPFKNLKLVDTGPDPKYPISADAGAAKWATAPLVEPIRPRLAGYADDQYPNNIYGETPHSGMANSLSALWASNGGLGDYVTVHSVVGWSGHCLSDIDKAGGKRAYPASVNEARLWKGFAAAANKTFGYGAITLTHGECDANNSAYGAGLYQFWRDYNADLKAITGQTQDVVLLVSQQSTFLGGAGGSAVQVWQAGVAHPGQIVCTGPKYQYTYAPDLVHFDGPGYERLGQKYAEVFDLVVHRKVAWKPLQPNKLVRDHGVITIAFDVPNPPMVWDSHITAPHQTINTEWAKGRGFEVSDGAGKHLAIADTKIQGSNVIITLAADPGAAVHVAYAITQDGMGYQGGTDLGMRGLLRDSDEFTGWDAETIESRVTSGSAVITSVQPSGYARRAGHDIVTGAGLVSDRVVTSRDNDGQITLSAPWPGPSGTAMLAFRHDERNYCVHFAMNE